jgi:hypothetical protein
MSSLKIAIIMAMKQIERAEEGQQIFVALALVLNIGGFLLWVWYARRKGFAKNLHDDFRWRFLIGSYLVIVLCAFFAFYFFLWLFFA